MGLQNDGAAKLQNLCNVVKTTEGCSHPYPMQMMGPSNSTRAQAVRFMTAFIQSPLAACRAETAFARLQYFPWAWQNSRMASMSSRVPASCSNALFRDVH